MFSFFHSPFRIPRSALRILFLLSLAAGCRTAAPPPVSLQWPVMDTVASVSVPTADAASLPDRRDVVQPVFADIERRFSVFRPDSDLARLNAAAGQPDGAALSPDVASVMEYALRLSAESGGAFDPTVGPLMAVWGFRGGSIRKVPSPDDLAAARSQVGWTNVTHAAADPRRFILPRAGMRLDLGGIAKGYAVDVAFDALRRAGPPAFLVDLGGNLRAWGEASPGRGGWRTGVRDPFAAGAAILGTLILTNGEAIATSGNYERYVVIDGQRYGHIMDPRTGRPAAGMAGVTVLAPAGIESDALTKPMYLMGPEQGAALLRRHPGCEALWVPDARPTRLIATAGFARRFTPLPEYREALTVVK